MGLILITGSKTTPLFYHGAIEVIQKREMSDTKAFFTAVKNSVPFTAFVGVFTNKMNERRLLKRYKALN
jgi:hypothetical protein